MGRVLLFFCFSFWMGLGICLADTVYLKDGRVFTGKVYEKGGKVYVELPYGTLSFSKDQVRKIERSSGGETPKVTSGASEPKGRGFLSLPRLQALQLRMRQLPSEWKLINPPPVPLTAAFWVKGDHSFRVAFQKRRFLDKVDEKGFNTRKLNEEVGKDFWGDWRFQVRHSRWIDFLGQRALEFSVQAYHTKYKFYYLTLYRVFSQGELEVVLQMTAPTSGTGSRAHAPLIAQFQSLCSALTTIPKREYRGRMLYNYERGYKIYVPKDWTFAEGKKPYIYFEGRKGEKIWVDPIGREDEYSFFEASKFAQKYLKKRFESLAVQKAKSRNGNYYIPGKFWQDKDIYNLECYVLLRGQTYYRVVLTYPSSFSLEERKTAYRIVDSFKSLFSATLRHLLEKEGRAVQLVRGAKKALQDRNYDAALAFIEQSLEKFPRYVEALLLQAEVAFAKKMPERALGSVRKILEIWPAHPIGNHIFSTVIYERALQLMREKNYAKVIEITRLGLQRPKVDLRLKKLFFQAHYNLLRLDLQNERKIPRVLTQALRLSSRHRKSIEWRKYIVSIFRAAQGRFLAKRDYRTMDRYYQKLLRIYRNYPDVKKAAIQYYLACSKNIWQREKNYSKAMSYARKASRVDSSNYSVKRHIENLKKWKKKLKR